MKIESKPDDLCDFCGHEIALHGRSDGHPDTLGCTWRHDSCKCREFVPPIVARLVEALEELASFSVLDKSDKAGIDSAILVDHKLTAACDLLVECGRMTKEGEMYRWCADPGGNRE